MRHGGGAPQVLSWRPLATLYEDFLTEAECDYLLNISRPLMEPAMLVNRKQQKHIRSKARTSWGAFHDSLGDPVLAAITQRIAHVIRVAPGVLLGLVSRACSLQPTPKHTALQACNRARVTSSIFLCQLGL